MNYRNLILTGAAAALAGATALAQQYPQPTKQSTTKGETTAARATIKGEGVDGQLNLLERKVGSAIVVDITLTAWGLKPGRHGVHLHAVGKCEAPFTSAGGHFDPGPAGNTDPDANHPYHMGDIPNLEVGENGRGSLKTVTSRITLSKGPLTVFDEDGTAVIIHGNEDKGISGESKSGVSGGPRIACGVISR